MKLKDIAERWRDAAWRTNRRTKELQAKLALANERAQRVEAQRSQLIRDALRVISVAQSCSSTHPQYAGYRLTETMEYRQFATLVHKLRHPCP